MKAHVPSWPSGTEDVVVDMGPKEAKALELGLDDIIRWFNRSSWTTCAEGPDFVVSPIEPERVTAIEALCKALKEARR